MRRRFGWLSGALILCACASSGVDSNGAGGAPGGGGVFPGGAAGGVGAAGGAPQGGIAASAGMAGSLPGAGGMSPAGTGGTPSVPAGQLMCGGKLCHAGGRCAADGSCPAFLGTCFSSVDKYDTCGGYCSKMGFACVEKSCNADGTPIMGGYSWVSYPASGRAECEKGASPDAFSFDACASPIWLSTSKPADDVVRCCCKG